MYKIIFNFYLIWGFKISLYNSSMIAVYLTFHRLIAVYRFDYFLLPKYSIQHFCFSNKSLNRTRLLNFAFILWSPRGSGLCGHVLTCRVRSGDIESDWEAFWSYDHYVIRAFLELRPIYAEPGWAKIDEIERTKRPRRHALKRWIFILRSEKEASLNLFILERGLRFVQAMRPTWTSLRSFSNWC